MSDLQALVDAVCEATDKAVRAQASRPAATYRLQFQRGSLTFRAAAALADYLAALGASHVYASPYLKSSAGSPHGYAVVDYGQLNPELGTEEDYEALIEALRQQGIGQILDIVPNHMSASPAENAWWHDVLENGPASPYADHFDIDWRPATEGLRNKVLLPVLGGQYGAILDAGQLTVEYAEGAFRLRYWETVLPIDPRTYPHILDIGLSELQETLPEESEELLELESIITALEYLPDCTETDPKRVAERQREKEVVKRRLRELAEASPVIAEYVDRCVAAVNGDASDPTSFDRLDALLETQPYRLSHWKAASDEINFRRFFDINDLAAVCMEEPAVFEEGHRFVFDLLVRGAVSGLRIDHIDGLLDPREYLWRLQWGYLKAVGQAALKQRLEEAATVAVPPPGAPAQRAGTAEAVVGESPPDWEAIEPQVIESLARRPGPLSAKVFPWKGLLEVVADDSPAGNGETAPVAPPPLPGVRAPLYVLVEKILGPEEPLPEDWLVAGTTGYDFLNVTGRLFIDPAGFGALTKIYARFIHQQMSFREVGYQARLLILRVAMSSELQLLAYRLKRLCQQDRHSRDFTLNTLRTALREILACFPVYRTYITERFIAPRDEAVVLRAVAQAKRRNPAMDAAVFDFIRDVLLLRQPAHLDEAGRREREFFIGRFQQTTSPVVAKGIEDTAFYRYYPLAALNEVGGEPDAGGADVETFHEENLARRRLWPEAMLASTTHDTKRSEDVRARLSVLSEIPQLWRAAVNRWARWNRRHRRDVDGEPAPSRNDEYLFYQSAVGIWPLEPVEGEGHRQLVERLQAYMEKATREAKVRTSWINPDEDYDAAVRDFVAAALAEGPRNRFLADLMAFHGHVADWGLYTSLSQLLLKLASPGVPDIYQGQEVWDFSLVDPDNRRPVDFDLLRWLLGEVSAAVEAGPKAQRELAARLAVTPRDNRLKLFVTWRTLQFRRRYAELFRRGDYHPLAVSGAKAEHVCAFAWRGPRNDGSDGEATAVVVVPRFLARLTPLPEEGGPPPPPLGAGTWSDTGVALPAPAAGPLRNLFTAAACPIEGTTLRLADALAEFPIALLSDSK